MPRMIFVNLPVTDLETSKRFYEGIGFRNEASFWRWSPGRSRRTSE